MFKRGFTLIELLAVIGIIAVLSSIIFVSLAGLKESARTNKAKSDMHQIMKAALMVYSEYGYYPSDSHSEVICPKLIEIEPGKSWGEYIDICEDPWGRPYEWNNVCANGHTRSTHINDPTCPQFSDENPGPVGVVYRGKTFTETDTICTGDDVCTGKRGHEQYDYTSAGYVPPSGPSCVSTISDCASLGVGCEFRTGCIAGTPSCTGSYGVSSACSNFTSQSTCNAQSPCQWTQGGNCAGTPAACSTYSNSTSCSGASCTWNPATCSGTPASCSSWGTNTSACTGAGCTPGGSCGGSPGASFCSAYQGYNGSKTDCTNNGCNCSSSAGSKCNTCISSGTTCTSASNQSICTTRGCTWTPNCSGTAPACTTKTNSTSCTAAGGTCQWGTASCDGTAPACATKTNLTSCTAAGGTCGWSDTSSCTGTYTTNTSCSAFTSESSCGSQATCYWTQGQCTGTAAPCNGFDQTQCGTQAGCSWQ